MEKTEELLSVMNGQLHELLGEHKEFKRETMERLNNIEQDLKNLPAARRASVCSFISITSSILALAGMFGLKIGGGLYDIKNYCRKPQRRKFFSTVHLPTAVKRI